MQRVKVTKSARGNRGYLQRLTLARRERRRTRGAQTQTAARGGRLRRSGPKPAIANAITVSVVTTAADSTNVLRAALRNASLDANLR